MYLNINYIKLILFILFLLIFLNITLLKNKQIENIKNISSNRIYFLCGNARTFTKCFPSIYENIISKLFNNNNKNNTHILLYLKCDDPGPKGWGQSNFKYNTIDKKQLHKKIQTYIIEYYKIQFHLKILFTNEITDKELLLQVKDRSKYTEFLGEDKRFLRALHCSYNIERCGKLINDIELKKNISFDYYIYIRPDLFFTEPCNNIKYYESNKILIGLSQSKLCQSHPIDDYFAIVPKIYKSYFFSRMKLFKSNKTITFKTYENIYKYIIEGKYDNKKIGKYIIKRE